MKKKAQRNKKFCRQNFYKTDKRQEEHTTLIQVVWGISMIHTIFTQKGKNSYKTEK